MRLVVGLGNPGPRHAGNRHNVGFMAADEIARRHSFAPFKSRFQALFTEGSVGPARLMVMKPLTYMNESGRAVGEALRFYKLAPSEVLVIHDEIDLAAGKVKVKQDGGNAGHNGLRSIDAHIGPDYWRLRIGVGHPGVKQLVHPHVLSDFTRDDAAWLDKTLGAIAEALPLLVAGDDNRFLTKIAFLTKPPRPKPRRAREGDAAPEEHGDPDKDGDEDLGA
jgi:peptidyl-tRNA hydrolase, PTH1 family